MRASQTESAQRATIALATAILVLNGCVQWFPGDVADGVARLTVRNLAAVATLANDDTACGFSSDAVLDSVVIEGDVGGPGFATWRVDNCTIETRDYVSGEDCKGAQTITTGSFTITAERRVVGRITGDPSNPIVPESTDAVLITLENVSFADFTVKSSASKPKLTIKSGSLSATMSPRLAKSAELGVCAVITPNATLEAIRYSNAKLHVDTGDRDFDVDVPSSDYAAQAGVKGDSENALAGVVTVWDSKQQVPGDGDGLDPDYKASDWVASYSCDEELATPIDFSCELEPFLGNGAARLSIRNFAALSAAIQDDAGCGFSSPAVDSNPEMIGTVGKAGGRAVYTVTDCELDFPEFYTVSTYCDDVRIRARGRAVVSGTLTIEGILTGDPSQPIVPLTRDPGVLAISAELTNWEVRSDESTASFQVYSGHLSGDITPRTAVDVTLGACSITTPVTRMRSVSLTSAHGQVRDGDMRLDVNIDDANLLAYTGEHENHENYLEGTVDIDGVHVVVEDNQLDPGYDADHFKMQYACKENMLIPESDAECDFNGMLASNAARLLVKTVASVVSNAENDTVCGFGAIDHMLPANLTQHADGSLTAAWGINDCTLDAGSTMQFTGENCSGTESYFTGRATVSGIKRATGEFATAYPPIQPTDRESVSFDISEILLHEYAAVDIAADGSTGPYLTVHSAVLRSRVQVITGEAADAPGRFYIATPVARIEGLEVISANVTLNYEGKQFRFILSQADLAAFNGRFGGNQNDLGGSLELDGKSFQVPVADYDTGLDPSYDPVAFDASYACTENLLEPVPSDG